MNVGHDVMELGIDFLGLPGETLGVLAHFQTGGGYAAGVDGLGGSYYEALAHKEEQSFVGGGHIGNFDVVLGAVGKDLLSFGHTDLVLICGGHADVALDFPGLLAGDELYAELVSIVLSLVAAGGAHLQHIVQLFLGADAVGIVAVAVGAGKGNDLCAQLGGLGGDAPCNVAEAGHYDGLALDGVMLMLEDFAYIVDSAEAGSLGTDQGAAVAEALAGEDAVLVSAANALILAEQIAYLAAAYADIAGGNVNAGTDVAIELGHEGLAETHDFCIALAVGVEIGTALAAAHGQRGQAVLEGLLEAEELHNGQIYVGSEAQAALVGADGAVELYAVAAVYVYLTGIVYPNNAELDSALGLYEALKKGCLLVFGVLLDNGLKRTQNFFYGLNEFFLVTVALFALFDYGLDVSVH